jgi:phosphoglycolate phosphatase-like HAD superfamily hydrolase
MKTLGLVNLIARVYAPRQLDDEEGAPRYSRAIPQNYVGLLSSRDRKPNPHVLLDICREYGRSPDEVIYVGDSLTRDVYMAKRAGVTSAWAEYGTTNRFSMALSTTTRRIVVRPTPYASGFSGCALRLSKGSGVRFHCDRQSAQANLAIP